MPRGSLALAVLAVLVVAVGCRPSGDTPAQPVPVGGAGAAVTTQAFGDPDPQTAERELARLKREIAALDEDENAMRDQLAKCLVEQDKAERDLASARTNAEQMKRALEAMSEAVKAAEANGEKRAAELRGKLEARVKEYKALAKQIETTEEMVKTRQAQKELLATQLESVRQVKADLRTAVSGLELSTKAWGSEASRPGAGRYKTDAGKVADLRESIDQLEKKVERENHRQELQKLDEPKRDVLKEVDDILGKPSK
jgi:chromosome segregation ATPase